MQHTYYMYADGSFILPYTRETHWQEVWGHYVCSMRTYRHSPGFLNWCVAKNSSCK